MSVRATLGYGVALVLMSISAVSCSDPGVAGDSKAEPQSRHSQSTSSSYGDSSISKRNLSAPAVPKALNAKPFLSKEQICKIVSPEQAGQLGLVKPRIGERTYNGLETTCNYESRNPSGNKISAGFHMANKHGLSDIYDKKTRQKTWEPFTVQGYPAVVVDKNDGTRSCSIYMGVTDRLAMELDYGGRDSVSAEQACQRDKKLAGMVVSNLKLQK